MSAIPADPREHEALEARFFDVICDDEELLAAEFQAIVSAAWRPALPTRPGGPALRGPQGAWDPIGRTATSARRRESTGVPAWARQRSPPTQASAPSGRGD